MLYFYSNSLVKISYKVLFNYKNSRNYNFIICFQLENWKYLVNNNNELYNFIGFFNENFLKYIYVKVNYFGF